MRLLSAVGCVTLATAASLLPVAPALADEAPPATRCPGAYEVLVVEDLVAQGYPIAFIDEEGNNNGLICGKPLPGWKQKIFCKKFGCGVPVIYYFVDDSAFLPAGVGTSL